MTRLAVSVCLDEELAKGGWSYLELNGAVGVNIAVQWSDEVKRDL